MSAAAATRKGALVVGVEQPLAAPIGLKIWQTARTRLASRSTGRQTWTDPRSTLTLAVLGRRGQRRRSAGRLRIRGSPGMIDRPKPRKTPQVSCSRTYRWTRSTMKQSSRSKKEPRGPQGSSRSERIARRMLRALTTHLKRSETFQRGPRSTLLSLPRP